MRTVLISVLLVFVNVAYSTQIECVPGQSNKIVNVTMQVPHPENILIYRPDGTAVYIMIDNFSSIRKWSITRELPGTVWVEGKESIEKVIKEEGVYRLYIANNLETEPSNTSYIECEFEIK